jgi:hypothetical protein
MPKRVEGVGRIDGDMKARARSNVVDADEDRPCELTPEQRHFQAVARTLIELSYSAMIQVGMHGVLLFRSRTAGSHVSSRVPMGRTGISGYGNPAATHVSVS